MKIILIIIAGVITSYRYFGHLRHPADFMRQATLLCLFAEAIISREGDTICFLTKQCQKEYQVPIVHEVIFRMLVMEPQAVHRGV